ncbi:MAG TPA: Nramp family divalent metal transporter, partial [Gemmatimonadaceae bacterium]|nr:Nramp family divalent metal transporter [Gemmatimonadaceae bacterium]
ASVDTRSIEARSGLDPWKKAELPEPPMPKGLGWLGVVGPGVIVLGAAIGGGEFLLGPAAFVRYGFSLLWITAVAVFLQTIFNTELMRYTLATGEPVFTGFMRTRPSATLWGWVYAFLFILQLGWPAWAANAAAAAFFLFTRRLPQAIDANAVYLIGVATFLLCVVILLFGRRIERTLEILNAVLIVCILGSFTVLALIFVPLSIWIAATAGYAGFSVQQGAFDFLPQNADFFLLGALAAYSGAGGVANVVLSNWARDRGYGMGQRTGFIPAAVGGKKVHVAHTGFIFTPDAESMKRWRGWWNVVRADQWGVFFVGAILGMLLPAMLYVHFLPAGSDIRGLGIAAALANAIGAQAGPMLAGVIAFLGVWLLFKSQLDLLEATVRVVTDLIWTGSKRMRTLRGGDVRALYYAVLVIVVIWGMIALRLAQPIVLLQLGANIAGGTMVIAGGHLLYINMRFLPVELRPPVWRRACLVAMMLFYSFFSFLAMRTLF